MGVMKTTVELPDALLREAKSVAALRNLKLKDLFTRGLEMALKAERKAAKVPPPLCVGNGGGGTANEEDYRRFIPYGLKMLV